MKQLKHQAVRACAAVALGAGLAAGPAHAQSDARVADLERKLEQALKQVEALGKRVQQLEGAQAKPQAAAPAAAPAPAPELAQKVKALEEEVAAIGNRPEEDRGLAVHGFADVGAGAGSKGRPTGAQISSVDFYLTPKLGDRVKSLIELNFEVGNDGTVGVDLERLQIGYTFSDTLTVWAGRFHTPYGYWNTAFHHGAQLQTAVSRPVFLEFEDAGGILPAHTVGLWGTGAIKTGYGKWHYDVYAGNSPSIKMEDPTQAGTGTLDPGLLGASNRKATVGFNLGYDFRGALAGLTLGVHALSYRTTDTALTPNSTRVNAYGLWATYLENDWEILAEGYRFANRDITGGTGSHTSSAMYAQAGRSFGTLTPYARYEMTSLDQADNYFAQQESGQSYRRYALGVRYDLSPVVAIKFEGNHTSLTDRLRNSYNEIRSQIAVRF